MQTEARLGWADALLESAQSQCIEAEAREREELSRRRLTLARPIYASLWALRIRLTGSLQSASMHANLTVVAPTCT